VGGFGVHSKYGLKGMTPEERFERFEISLHNIRDILAETAALASGTEARLARTEAALRRAIRLAVREALAERERRRSADERLQGAMNQLALAQKVTEEKLQRFLEWRSHPNGDEE